MVARRMNKSLDINDLPTLKETMYTDRFIIPSGVDIVDHLILGVGGLPTSRVVEIAGDEGSGKTTFCMNIARNTIRNGGMVILLDMEGDWTPDRLRMVGFTDEDFARIRVLHKQFWEEYFEALYQLIENLRKKQQEDGLNIPITIVVDSVAFGLTKQQYDSMIASKHAPVAALASFFSQRLPLLEYWLRELPVLLLLINQFRQQLNLTSPYMQAIQPIETTGGRAIKYAASVRLTIKMLRKVDEKLSNDGIPIGYIARIEQLKNKLNAPVFTGEYLQYFNGRVGNWYTYIQEGVNYGIIEQKGGWYAFKDHKFRRRADVEKEPWYPELKEAVQAKWKEEIERIKQTQAEEGGTNE